MKPSYGVFVGELYRICKSSSVVTEFIHDVKLLIDKLITQNFERKILIVSQRVSLDQQPKYSRKLPDIMIFENKKRFYSSFNKKKG